MKQFILRPFWRAVLCEPEEIAELLAASMDTPEKIAAFEKRLARYELAFGKGNP